MIDFLFGFDRFREVDQSWIFTIRHLGLLLFSVAALVGLWFLLNAKTKKRINRTKIALIIALFTFEIGRMLWRVFRHIYRYDTIAGHNWTFTWSFQICATFVWVSIATLILTMYLNKDNKYLVVLKNILFGAASIGGLFTFVFPEHIHENRYVFHWLNLQTIIQHILIVFVPLYLLKIRELEVKSKNIWMPVLGFLGATNLAMVAAHVTGDNFAMVLGHLWIEENLPFLIPHPWQLIFIFVLAFTGTIILYTTAILVSKKLNIEYTNDLKNDNPQFLKFKKMCLIIGISVGVFTTIMTMFLPMWLGADYSQVHYRDRSLNSPLGFIVLIPFIILIVSIWYMDILIKKKEKQLI